MCYVSAIRKVHTVLFVCLFIMFIHDKHHSFKGNHGNGLKEGDTSCTSIPLLLPYHSFKGNHGNGLKEGDTSCTSIPLLLPYSGMR